MKSQRQKVYLFATPFPKKKDATRCNKTIKNTIYNGNKKIVKKSLINKLENDCLEITFNELYFKKDKKDKIENIIIESTCTKKHKNKMYLSNFIQDENQNSLKLINLNCECYDLHLNDNLNQYYCVYDKKIICENDKIEHLYHNNKNYLINKNKYDSYCLNDILKYTYFCTFCKVNLCNKCKELHNKKDCNIKEITFITQCILQQFKHKIEIAKNDIENINSYIIKASKLCKMESLIKSLNIYKNLNCLIIQYAEEIFDITLNKQKENNLNYQILFNFNYLFERFQSPNYNYLEGNDNGIFLKNISKFVKDSKNFILNLDFEENKKYFLTENDKVDEYDDINEKILEIKVPNGQSGNKNIKYIETNFSIDSFDSSENGLNINKSCNFVKHYRYLIKKDKEERRNITEKNNKC